MATVHFEMKQMKTRKPGSKQLFIDEVPLLPPVVATKERVSQRTKTMQMLDANGAAQVKVAHATWMQRVVPQGSSRG